MLADSPTIEGASSLFIYPGVGLHALEYSGYRKEVLASKESAYLGCSLNSSPVYDVSGPDAAKFLSSICVNDFTKMKVGKIRHAIICNDKGLMLTDGVVMKIAEDTFRTYWLEPVIGYYVSISDMNIVGKDIFRQEFFFQIAGPRSLEILEKAANTSLRHIDFATHAVTKIEGVDVRILRLGMAGTLAYEFHGEMKDADKVYQAVWEAGQEFGIKKLGQVAYVMNHTEGGFPNIHIHYPLPWFETDGLKDYMENHPMGFFNKYRSLYGSAGDDLDLRFKNPYQVGWGFKVNFDHDFMGKEALLEISKTNRTIPVTLEWNAQDVAAVYATQFQGEDVEPCDSIEDLPSDTNYNNTEGFFYRQDKVFDGDKLIGISAGRTHSIYYRRMISIGFIDKDAAIEGKDLKLLWGRPGTSQKEIRVKVARYPYVDLENNKDIDVTKI